jgi:hypothetical protein
MGRDSLELIHADDRKLARPPLQKVLAAPLNPAQVEVRFPRGGTMALDRNYIQQSTG